MNLLKSNQNKFLLLNRTNQWIVRWIHLKFPEFIWVNILIRFE